MKSDNKLEKLSLDLDDWLDDADDFFMHLVDNHAKPLALISHNPDLLINDFVYFCVTKSYRTLRAIRILINQKFNEDALILLRSVYENYLSSAYVMRTPDALEYFVYNRIGLWVGVLEHPITPKGRKDVRKVINKKTNEVSSLTISISDLAKGTGVQEDQGLFISLYDYLCQHTHSNMISSGNYRTDDACRYTYCCHKEPLQAKYYTTLITALLTQCLLNFQNFPEEHKHQLLMLANCAKNLLMRELDTFDFTTVEGLKHAIPNRLNAFKIFEPVKEM